MGQVVSMSDHKKKKKRRIGFRKMRWILLFLVCALIGFGISQAPLFNVKNIDVSGNENVDSSVIIGLSGVKENQPIGSVRTGRAETMIETNPWVKSAVVKRRFPNTIVIKVVERTPVAAVAAGNGVLIVDEEGSVLAKQELFDGLPYMLIIGVDDLTEEQSDEQAAQEQGADKAADDDADKKSTDENSQTGSSDNPNSNNKNADNPNSDNQNSDTESMDNENQYDNLDGNSSAGGDENAADNSSSDKTEAAANRDSEAEQADSKAYAAVKGYDDIVCGEKLKSAKLSSGLQIAGSMTAEEMAVVTQINVLDAQNIIIDTVYGIKIYFGDENDIESKFDVVNTVLTDEKQKGHITKINYIDVSVPSHPALKYNN